MYNRRLRSDEIETWVNYCCPEGIDRERFGEYAKEFMQMEDSMYFISSVEDRFVGGTAVYRDRVRLAMALVYLSLEKKYRESVVAHLIKSSLPFFKSMSIRNVDAIVNPSDNITSLPFPLSTELADWTTKSLETLKFEKIDTVYKIRFENIKRPEEKVSLFWDSECNYEGSRKLMWDLRKETGLNFSQVWLLRDIMYRYNSFHTVTLDDEVAACAGLIKLGRIGIIAPLFVHSQVSLTDSLGILIDQLGGVKTIEMPLVGKGQIRVIKFLEDILQTDAKIQELLLYRKNL